MQSRYHHTDTGVAVLIIFQVLKCNTGELTPSPPWRRRQVSLPLSLSLFTPCRCRFERQLLCSLPVSDLRAPSLGKHFSSATRLDHSGLLEACCEAVALRKLNLGFCLLLEIALSRRTCLWLYERRLFEQMEVLCFEVWRRGRKAKDTKYVGLLTAEKALDALQAENPLWTGKLTVKDNEVGLVKPHKMDSSKIHVLQLTDPAGRKSFCKCARLSSNGLQQMLSMILSAISANLPG